MPQEPMVYDLHDKLDPFKIEAGRAASSTDSFARNFGFHVVPWSRGESCFLIETPFGYLGLVVEGLGTKNRAADAYRKVANRMEELAGRSYYDNLGQCTVAMIVNDMITLGVQPVALGQYLAVGDPSWFDDVRRRRELIDGTRRACRLARCVWGPGETPGLQSIIYPDAADLAGAAMGFLAEKQKVFSPMKIQHGDAIIVAESSGPHANGYTKARELAEKLPNGYLTPVAHGRTYGELLLDATHIYVGFVQDCVDAGAEIHYGVNITGHGWRKLMRANSNFTYVIDRMPSSQAIFNFIREYGPVEEREMYRTYNMGAGFALYVAEKDVDLVLQVGSKFDFKVFKAGYIEQSDEKKVVIRPKNITFGAEELALR